ncbi:thermonuclease family protein [Marinomonas piezotolerans]|nr:thermonuclease family protein [Marinomonas piezotolerans]
MSILKKRRAFCLALFLWLPFGSYAQCVAQGELNVAQVSKVIDGDTIHLTDGRKVRLIGVDTPELDHRDGNHDDFAVEARMMLKKLAGQVVYWQVGLEPEDRYGRKLYYLFTKDRVSISSELLSAGLGYRVAIPPNLNYQSCFDQAELEARHAMRGLWQKPPLWQPKAGFTVVRPTIDLVTRNRGGWWLETEWDLVIHIPRFAEHFWTEKELFLLQGKAVEARGWQYQRKKRQNDRFKSFVLTVKHPQDLRRITVSQ